MTPGTATVREPAPVVLVGAHGHGRWHLANLRRLSALGTARLVGVCDRVPVAREDLTGLGDPAQCEDLAVLLDNTGAAAVILATPIHTHLPLARTALRHGAHVLLEKPPTATLAEYRSLCEAVAGSGLACQVGFQNLGSTAVDAARDLALSGAIGAVRGIGGAGAWVRTSAYYERAPWAGRRRMDGADVVDGALTNPFAHAVATALRLAGAGRGAAADGVELELFRAHAIESDDTSCLRLRAPDGTPVSVAVTLCATRRHEPHVSLHGESGRITVHYTRDEVTLERGGGAPETVAHPRIDLLENLLAHIGDGTPLLVPPEETAGFMTVLEAVRTAPDPLPIPEHAQQVFTAEDGLHRVVTGIDDLVERSARGTALFSELGAPWASPRRADAAGTAGATR
ncbi:putative dehydrogenase [Spinactinospora alkalitolerans]|uniref:Putative dehydrogenase n=1 Tax=Spinactinospora alkalitolerans TaxID=687207 RepID=A0A852TZJ5_9ACTN|nr:Gfo/Idh/MocA family oxidoreductase [Spinactinospora alkalitolerans]NYE47200.1 putative dehydrogenase [Spinactinospora alkalitolerans]